MELIPDNLFAERFSAPVLRSAHNRDGGWGFHPGGSSRVEPTCWALKALMSLESTRDSDGHAITRALSFLTAAQLPDGSWPSTAEEKTGCWVTSLACWVLAGAREEKYSQAIASGLIWICDDWPAIAVGGKETCALFGRAIRGKTIGIVDGDGRPAPAVG